MPNQVFKVALPGYNAQTDTDPNHFSLYVDQATDYVLIKEKTRGSINCNNATTTSVAHGLSYIPFVLAYAIVGDDYVFLSGGDLTGTYNFKMTVDSTNINFINGTGSARVVKYYIFYDAQKSGTPASIPLSGKVVAVSKIGKNAYTSTDPNDFIFRSDLNTFKITGTGTDTFTVTAESTETKSIAHGLDYIPAVIGFSRKSGSTKVIGPSQFFLGFLTDYYKLFSVWADDTNVNFELRNDAGTNADIDVRYYTFEVPL